MSSNNYTTPNILAGEGLDFEEPSFDLEPNYSSLGEALYPREFYRDHIKTTQLPAEPSFDLIDSKLHLTTSEELNKEFFPHLYKNNFSGSVFTVDDDDTEETQPSNTNISDDSSEETNPQAISAYENTESANTQASTDTIMPKD